MLNPGDTGIDVSNFQHPGNAPINYNAVAALHRFAYIEVTDGTTFVNSYANQDAKGFQAAGMQTGAYQFFRPDQDSGKQLNDFIKAFTAIGGWTLPVMIDAETESDAGWANLSQQLHDFRTNLIGALHCEVGYYVNQNFYDNLSGFPWGAPVWLADPSHPNAPSKPCLLQQTGIGTVPGIQGQCDLDVWRQPYGSQPIPTPTTEEDMPWIVADPDPNANGAQYLVSSDLTTKVHIASPSDQQALSTAGVKDLKLTAGQFDAIPTAG